MNSKRNRVTLPAKIVDHLYNDEEFFREVSSVKKMTISRFPRNDQWVSEEGFNMVFALAGYGSEDLSVEIKESRLTISSKGQMSIEEEGDNPKKTVSHGVVNRGIARRNFKVSYVVSEDFDTKSVHASMSKGLLHIIIPRKKDIFKKFVDIMEKQWVTLKIY